MSCPRKGTAASYQREGTIAMESEVIRGPRLTRFLVPDTLTVSTAPHFREIWRQYGFSRQLRQNPGKAPPAVLPGSADQGPLGGGRTAAAGRSCSASRQHGGDRRRHLLVSSGGLTNYGRGLHGSDVQGLTRRDHAVRVCDCFGHEDILAWREVG